jgi:probable HAF family extracellular repeat protein
MMWTALTILLLAGAILAPQAVLGGPLGPYAVTDIGILPGFVSSTATAVDNLGEVVGYDTDASGNTEAFYWTKAGGLIDLGRGEALGVSNGNAVGNMLPPTGGQDAFRWTPATGTSLLDTNASDLSAALGVNSSGEVIGDVDNSGAVVWSPTNAISAEGELSERGVAINDLGQYVGIAVNRTQFYNVNVADTGSVAVIGNFLATSLNNSGMIAGAHNDASSHSVAAVYNSNTNAITTIGYVGGDLTANATGINDQNVVVGTSGAAANGTIGFLWDSTDGLHTLGSLLTPAASMWAIQAANGISNTGLIAAEANTGGVTPFEAVLLTPVPEPGTLALGLLALASMSPIVRRLRTPMMRTALTIFLLIGAILAPSNTAFADPAYSVTDIGLLPGAVSGVATSIDASGEVAGTDTFSDGSTEAFFWTQSSGLVGLGETNSKAFGVNNGNVVGISGAQAFRWTSGTGVVLLDLTKNGQANGINSSGEIIGQRISGSTHTAVTWSPSPANTISLHFNGIDLTGTAINDSGDFVGVNNGSIGYFSNGSTRTNISILPDSLSNSLLTAGSSGTIAAYENINSLSTTTIGTLSGDNTSNALGINPSGTEIVGVSNGHGGFLYDVASANLQSLTSLLVPADNGWQITSASAINDTGLIAATATLGGVQHAVLLTVPEPGTFVLGLFATLAFVLPIIRQRRTDSPAVPR